MRPLREKPHVSWLDRPFTIVLIIVLILLLYIGSMWWMWHMMDMAGDEPILSVRMTLDAAPKGTQAR